MFHETSRIIWYEGLLELNLHRALLGVLSSGCCTATAQVPGSRKYALAGAGRGLKQRLYAGKQGDGCCLTGGLTLGSEHHDCVTFFQVGKRKRRCPIEHLLNVAATLAGSASTGSGRLTAVRARSMALP